ncbi:hypothetical protein DFH29DRAFT_876035 [Suillus ampliporus]|nr:hypothetical protein DFH29DRAFT_876035 [Suillus ampliporus]
MSFASAKEITRYACPEFATDGSIGYDYALENYFGVATMDKEPFLNPPDDVYDIVARAWNSHPHPQGFVWERPCYFARVMENSPCDMGITWDRPGYRPRRSSYEERRGTVPVRPSEINTLVPYTPSTDYGEDPALQSASASASLFIPESNSLAADGPIGTQCNDHSSDADDELDDCGYSTESTMTSQPHSLKQDLPTLLTSYLSPMSWSGDEDSFASSSTSDVESDDGCDNTDVSAYLMSGRRQSSCFSGGHDIALSQSIRRHVSEPFSLPPPCTPTSFSNDPDLGIRAAVTKRPRNSSAPPKRSNKKQKYLSDEQTVTTRRPSSSYDTFTPTRGSDDTEYEPPASAKGRSAASPKQTLFPCLLDGCIQVCYSTTDLARHRQSLRHRPAEYSCLGCRRTFTRPDALKRHLNGKPACKKARQAALVTSEA